MCVCGGGRLKLWKESKKLLKLKNAERGGTTWGRQTEPGGHGEGLKADRSGSGTGAVLRRHRRDGLTSRPPLHLVCVLVYLLETTTTTSLCNYSLVLLHSP